MTELVDPATPVPHDEVRRYLKQSSPSPAPWTRDIEVLRCETREAAMAVRGGLEPVAAVRALRVAGVPARLYQPAEPPSIGGQPGRSGRNVLIWLHGGGWMHGDLDCYEGVARAFANRAGCSVLAVDYRLAPEHPFPAGFDDAWAAVEWSAASFDRVAVAGDSSGGNLAAAAALKARDKNVRLAAQVLVYPVLESRADTEFKRAFQARYTRFGNQADFGSDSFERINYIWDTYVPDRAVRDCPYASPARVGTLRGVAPAVIITAEHDILRREAQDYARRLRVDGVPVAFRDYAGQIHGFFQMRGVMSAAQDAMNLAAEYLRREFDRR
jgi:acetyl esterase/lipase